jgi:hypothetical protein
VLVLGGRRIRLGPIDRQAPALDVGKLMAKERSSMALPRLVRRNDIVDMSHVAFRFEHKNKRHTAFVDYAALATLAAGHPLKVFDGYLQRLLRLAADLADGGRIAEDDTIRVKAADLKAKGKAR